MIERWRTPSVPIKRYGREILGKEKAEPNFAKAVVHFLDTAYWIDNNIGDPNRHRAQALRRASRLVTGGLLEAAQNTAESLYAQYKELAGIQPDEPLTYSAIAALERARRGSDPLPSTETTLVPRRIVTTRDIAEKAFDEKKQAAKRKFIDHFQQLMKQTDKRLKIANSNDRIQFEENLVFSNSDEDIQRRIRQRKLSGKRYAEEETRIKGEQELMGPAEEDIDPYEKVMAILMLANNPTKQNVTKLARELENGDAMVREAAADALVDAGWRPRNQEEAVSYYIAKEDWGRVLDVGDVAIPVLVRGLTRIKELPVRQMITDVLDEFGYDPASANLRQRVFYYSVKDDFYHLEKMGASAIPYITETMKKGVLSYPTGTRILGELESVAAERTLPVWPWIRMKIYNYLLRKH